MGEKASMEGLISALNWHVEHIVLPSSLYLVKEKHFLIYSAIFYPLFSLSSLGRYQHSVVLLLSFSWKEGQRLQASSAISANAAL